MKKIFLFLIIILAGINSNAQSFKWPLPPNEINFSNSNPTLSSIADGYNLPYYGSEAAYDDNGNMLFYVAFSNNNKFIYKPGTVEPIGQLHAMGGYGIPSEECIITKVPNSSNKYYIIYSVKTMYNASKIGYSVVENNGGTITILQNGVEIEPTFRFVGKTIIEINSDKYLYFTYFNGAVKRCLIGSNNISGVTTVLSETNTNIDAYEFETNNLESSIDGRKIAWVNFEAQTVIYPNTEIIVVDLDINGNYSSYQTYSFSKSVYGKINGIEFTTNEENDVIYFTASADNIDGNIYKLSLINGTTQSLATANEFGNTWLQTASDGNIYCVSNDGSHLGRIQPFSNVFNSNVLSFSPAILSNAAVTNSDSYSDYDIYHLPSNHSFTHFSLALEIKDHESCAATMDGKLEAIATGGLEPYTYQWDDPQNQTTAVATGLTQGVYNCTVTDAAGRTKTLSIELTTNPAIFNYPGPYEINSNVNWQGNHYKIDKPIHIRNGGSLTIKYGAKAEFNADAGFIVHDGGELIITDNSELSGLAACGYNNWAGITVMDNGYVKGHSFKIRDCESTVQEGGTMHIDANANIFLTENTKLVVEDGGYICIAPSAHIDLALEDCEIELIDGSLLGVNPLLNITPTPSCSNDPCDWNITGLGSFHINDNYTHLDDMIIQANATVSYNNENWSFKKNIILEANSELTISNSNFYFSETSKIIVKPGAKLIIENSTLDRNQSCLIDYWMGIEVWGNSNQGQTEAYQGKLVLNGATIEHAHEAVQLWKPEDYNKTGGMISAVNTTFRNNKRAVSFLSYKNIRFGVEWNYVSSFSQCTFENTTNYDMDNPFLAFVTMWKVRGVSFTACDFINSSAFPASKAIYTLDAGYKFKGMCTGVSGPNGECVSGWETNTFTKFEKAIESGNTTLTTQYAIAIEDSYFENNHYGIFMTTVESAATIINNEFEIGNNGIDNFEKEKCSYFSARGIQMNQSFGFDIEENTFSKMQGTTGGDVVGVLVNTCPSSLDDIYKNSFDDLTAGNQAEGKNRLSDPLDDHEGVTYLCNQNQNNTHDIYVAASNDPMINGHIGSLQEASGNTLSNTSINLRNDGVQDIRYYYNPNVSGEILPDISYTDYVIPIAAYNSNDCLSNFGGGGGTGLETKLTLSSTEKLEVEQDFYSNYQDYEAVDNLLEDLKDGGSTETTSLSIASAQPTDTWELRANLLGMSPYLSKEVLMEASDRTDVLPESVLFEILSANPDELRKTDLMDHLENKEQPLPDYMISILRQMSNGSSAKTALLSQKSFYNKKKADAAQTMIRSIKNEEELNIVELRNWLGNMGNMEADKQIVATYLYEENYNFANTLLNLIPNLYDLEGENLQDFNDYKELLNLQINLKQQDRNVFTMSENEKYQLIDLADNSNGEAKYGAQNILSFVYGEDYCDCISPIEGGYKSSQSSLSYDEDDIAKAMGLSVSAKPNPANVYVSLDYKLPIGIEQATLQIVNVEGKVIYTTSLQHTQGQLSLDISNYKRGAYIYKIVAGDYSISESLIIQ